MNKNQIVLFIVILVLGGGLVEVTASPANSASVSSSSLERLSESQVRLTTVAVFTLDENQSKIYWVFYLFPSKVEVENGMIGGINVLYKGLGMGSVTGYTTDTEKEVSGSWIYEEEYATDSGVEPGDFVYMRFLVFGDDLSTVLVRSEWIVHKWPTDVGSSSSGESGLSRINTTNALILACFVVGGVVILVIIGYYIKYTGGLYGPLVKLFNGPRYYKDEYDAFDSADRQGGENEVIQEGDRYRVVRKFSTDPPPKPVGNGRYRTLDDAMRFEDRRPGSDTVRIDHQTGFWLVDKVRKR